MRNNVTSGEKEARSNCETAKNSLSLQWLSKEEAPPVLGKLIAVSSITSLFLYCAIWSLLEIFNLDYKFIFFYILWSKLLSLSLVPFQLPVV